MEVKGQKKKINNKSDFWLSMPNFFEMDKTPQKSQNFSSQLRSKHIVN